MPLCRQASEPPCNRATEYPNTFSLCHRAATYNRAIPPSTTMSPHRCTTASLQLSPFRHVLADISLHENVSKLNSYSHVVLSRNHRTRAFIQRNSPDPNLKMMHKFSPMNACYEKICRTLINVQTETILINVEKAKVPTRPIRVPCSQSCDYTYDSNGS